MLSARAELPPPVIHRSFGAWRRIPQDVSTTSGRGPSGFPQRLRTAGEPAKVCLTAVVRQMITVLNHMRRDPNFTLVS